MKARDIMTTPIITADEDTPVIDVVKDMENLRIGSVVITSKGKPAGIITERDIALKVLLNDRKASEVKAKDVMSSPLMTIEPDTPVEKACEILIERGIKRLPVVENEVLVGIVSLRNILSKKPEYVRKFYPEVKVLASGWTLDRLERALTEAKKSFMVGMMDDYKDQVKGVYEELKDLAVSYSDDKELRDVCSEFEGLYNRLEELTGDEHRTLLDRVLRKLRHITHWRKQQSISSFASGVFWFRDYRWGKELRLPFKGRR